MTRARELSKLVNDAVFSVDANNNVGVNSTTPDAKFDVIGVVSATTYYGDGSNLSGITAGATLSAGSGSQRVVVTSLTSGTMTSAATDAELTYNSDTNTLTATTFSGALSGNATGLSGTPNIDVGNVTGAAATFTGNVSIAGTLTYEDVTNIDSVGLITARSGVRIDAGGLVVTAGVSTLTTLIPDQTRFVTVAEKLTRIDGNTINLVYTSSGSNIGLATNPSGNITLNVTDIPETSDFDNHVVTFSVFVTNTGTARTVTAVNLNGVSKTINWAGGSLSAALVGVTTSNGIDIYSFTGINTVGSASTTANYRVLGVVNGGFF